MVAPAGSQMPFHEGQAIGNLGPRDLLRLRAVFGMEQPRAEHLMQLGGDEVEPRLQLRPGGVMFAAAISRYASALDGLARDFFADPSFSRIVQQDLEQGQHRNETEVTYRSLCQG
jgi:hypothetical protein